MDSGFVCEINLASVPPGADTQTVEKCKQGSIVFDLREDGDDKVRTEKIGRAHV